MVNWISQSAEYLKYAKIFGAEFLYLLKILVTRFCWFYAYWRSWQPILADFMLYAHQWTNYYLFLIHSNFQKVLFLLRSKNHHSCFVQISKMNHSCYVPKKHRSCFVPIYKMYRSCYVPQSFVLVLFQNGSYVRFWQHCGLFSIGFVYIQHIT